MKTLKFKTNINCGGCLKAVSRVLDENKEIKHWAVDIDNPEKILTVEGELGEEDVIKTVAKAGFKAEGIE